LVKETPLLLTHTMSLCLPPHASDSAIQHYPMGHSPFPSRSSLCSWNERCNSPFIPYQYLHPPAMRSLSSRAAVTLDFCESESESESSVGPESQNQKNDS
jgi:hypothetical protein